MALLAFYSPLAFESCTFRALSVAPEPGPIVAFGRVYGALQANGLNATLALKNCTFADIPAAYPIGITDAELYSDNPAQQVHWHHILYSIPTIQLFLSSWYRA